MRIAMAQINAIVGDLEGNTRKICEAIEAAAEKGADLIAFPELALTGYPPEDLLLKPDFVAANREALLEVARRTPAVSVVVGFVDADDHLYNAAALLYDGRVAGIYHKHRLPNYGVFDEKRYFRPGAECPLFALDNAPIAVTVCEDVCAPGGPPQAAARAGALLLININASPYPPRGAPPPPPPPPPREPLEEISQALVLGTRDYVRKNRFRDVVVGLSGGIDSALVSAIAVDALGPGPGRVAPRPA